MSDWKPGDVAKIPFTRGQVVSLYTTEGWVRADNTRPIRVLKDPRRLAVVDPDNPDDVDALCEVLVEAMHRAGDKASAANGVHPATMAAALREYATPTPPKPDEPTGLGAVVEDADGNLWVRAGEGGWWRGEEDNGYSCNWAAVRQRNVVRVLSEGVTP